MLISHYNDHEDTSALENARNYYEILVFEAIEITLADQSKTLDYIADITCISLNHLPPRYIRHVVDMAFYLSDDELEEMHQKVQKAVDNAIDFVEKSNKQYG